MFFVFFTSMEKLPIISVCDAETIRLFASFSTTLAIMIGPISSLTVPEITRVWAKEERERNINKTKRTTVSPPALPRRDGAGVRKAFAICRNMLCILYIFSLKLNKLKLVSNDAFSIFNWLCSPLIYPFSDKR